MGNLRLFPHVLFELMELLPLDLFPLNYRCIFISEELFNNLESVTKFLFESPKLMFG